MAKKFSGRYNLNDQARLNTAGKSSEQTIWTKNDKTRAVDCLVIAGGGGGGGGFSGYSGGGAGGGGWRQAQVMITPGITYTVVVGTGGAGVPGGTQGTSGSPSQFGPIVSCGGGAGGYYTSPGGYGGSTGGAGGFAGVSGVINTPSSGTATIFPGDQGMIGQNAFPGNRGGGGGGYAQLQDQNWFTYSLGGHTGGLSFITGTQQFYAAGGASGDSPTGTGNSAANTNGGGGGGGTAPAPTGTNGSQNTGGGGGGGFSNNGNSGSGGSGIVIIRYPDIYADPVSVTGTYNTANTGSGFKVYTWTATGSITF